MPKMGKIVLAILVPLLVIVGGLYGLAKVGIIPVAQFAEKNKALIPVLKMAGLYHPKPASKTKVVLAHDTVPAPDPLAPQRAELEQERAALQAQRDAAQRAASAAQAAQPDPRNLARLATVYEQMPPESVTRIFAKLPADHVIGILRRMDEKKVGDILALLPPDRAAQVTEALSRPAPPDSTAANTP